MAATAFLKLQKTPPKFFGVRSRQRRGSLRLQQPDYEKLEEVMNTFDSPVYVRDGYITVQIAGIPQALAFLAKWPMSKRGVVYECVGWGMIAAQQGLLPVEAARNAFEGWARAHRVLVQNQAENPKGNDASNVVPVRAHPVALASLVPIAIRQDAAP